MTNFLHESDIPNEINLGSVVAVDTETMGLNNLRDRLCVVQLSAGNGDAHIVKLNHEKYDCPNLVKLFSNENILKIFHFARFDVSVIKNYLLTDTNNVYCTKIASKLARTYTGNHGLKDLCSELIGVKISKAQQSSDWGCEKLSKEQVDYAASDVLYLHKLKEKLDEILIREKRNNLALKCFEFIQTRSDLDLAGWSETDIFAHK